MNTKEYEKLKQQIQDRYEADMNALERIRQLTADPASSPDIWSPTLEEVSQLVTEILPEMNGDIFTRRLITAKIREKQPTVSPTVQDTVGVVLKRLTDAGEILLHRKGSGKRGSEYRRALPLKLDDEQVLPID